MKGFVYRLDCQNGYYYIGSTTQTLSQRLKTHKWCSSSSSSPLYKYIATTGWDSVEINSIEEVECETKQELKQIESKYIQFHRNTPLCLNRNLAILTKEDKQKKDREYAKSHTEQKRENHKKWREANRERMREHQKKWRDANKEHITEYNKMYYGSKSSLD